MIVYSAPLAALPLLPAAECLDISRRGARSIPTANGAWLSPSVEIVEAWIAAYRGAWKVRDMPDVARRQRDAAWERFASLYRCHVQEALWPEELHTPMPALDLFDRPRLYILDDGDDIARPPGVAPCDPDRTPRAVVRSVLVGLGAEDGGEWKP